MLQLQDSNKKRIHLYARVHKRRF